MRTKNFFLALLATLVMVSCNKEQSNLQNPVGPGEKATLRISFLSNGPKTISPATDGKDVDQSINNYVLYFLRADGSFDRTPYFSATSQATDTFSVTTNLSAIYAIFNAYTGSNMALLKSATNKTTLEALVLDMDASAGVSSQIYANGTGANVYQSGIATVTALNPAPAVNVIPVTVQFMPAKVKVKVIDAFVNNTGGTGPAGAHCVLKSVALINGKKLSKVFGSDLWFDHASNSYYSGVVSNHSGAAVKNYYNDDITGANLTNDRFYFYAWSNTAAFGSDYTVASFSTGVVVEYDEYVTNPGNPTTRYYNAFFNAQDLTSKLKNGIMYELSFNIKADASTGGGGSLDPEIPQNNIQVQVTLTPAAWVTGPVFEKEFN